MGHVRRSGIGTTAQVCKLHVESNGSGEHIQIRNGANRKVDMGEATGSQGYLEVRGTSDALNIRLDGKGPSYLNGGNVGIGTTSPQQELHISSSAPQIRIENTSVAANDFDILVGSGRFGIAAVGGTENLTIEASGNVGIGTTTPQYKLDTIGNSRIDGWLVLDDEAGAKSGSCSTPGAIKYAAPHFYGCAGNTWRQLDN